MLGKVNEPCTLKLLGSSGTRLGEREVDLQLKQPRRYHQRLRHFYTTHFLDLSPNAQGLARLPLAGYLALNMAFGGFENSGNTMSALGSGGGAAGVVEGPELELIQTEVGFRRAFVHGLDHHANLFLQLLGFKSIAGEAKVRLTTPWSQLPSDNSSLLSIAARKGLVAAAGPDAIILSSTNSVRKAFEGTKEGDSDILGFEPQLKLPLPMRVSQIAFTADEAHLILSAESGGGLAVYQTADLLQGSQQAAFELGTNGESLRALVPNPTTEKAELCAIVTNNGNLHMANFKERQLSNVLKTGVSCVSWSTKGKQLVAGLADGTVSQMTPEGEGKGEIPCPPSVSNAHGKSL